MLLVKGIISSAEEKKTYMTKSNNGRSTWTVQYLNDTSGFYFRLL